jgi:hypothetical protein
MSFAHPAIRRTLAGCAGIALLGCLAGGCLKIEPQLTLNADGSGTLLLQYGMTEAALDRVKIAQNISRELAFAANPSNPPAVSAALPLLFSDNELRRTLQPFAARGIVAKNIKLDTRREWRTVQLELVFKDIRAVFDLPFFKDCAIQLAREAEGVYRLNVQTPKLSRLGTLPDLTDKSNRETLSLLLAGLAVTVRVNAPAEVVATNAGRKTPRAGMWEFDFDRDPQALQRLDGYLLTMAFRSRGVNLPDYSRQAGEPAGK